MKIDYLESSAAECPLLRLYNFTPEEVERLRQACEMLAEGKAVQLRLDAILPVESLDGPRLTFVAGKRDAGIIGAGGYEFTLMLTPLWWQQVAGLLEPFCRGISGYQWLSDQGDIVLLISVDGRW